MDMDMDIQVLNQLAGLNPTMLENLKLTDFQVGGTSQPEFPASSTYHFPPTTSQSDYANGRTIIHSKALAQDVCNDNKMKKVTEPTNSSSSTVISSSTAFVNGLKVNNDSTKKKNGLGKGKKGRNGEIKLGEVIHVRARRGQATDSHSLAERVRRQRINSRFKRLQDIVPGCHKTMGMAVMLDEIINYVQSLQNQVEFLSMELASASSSDDFNSDRDAIGINTAPGEEHIGGVRGPGGN